MRNPADISYAYHIKIAFSRGPPLKIIVVIKGIINIIYNEIIYSHTQSAGNKKKKRFPRAQWL